MAMDLLGARLTVLHDAPAVDASLLGARLTVLHDAPALNAALLGARLTVLHDAPALNAALLGARLTLVHSGPFQYQSAADAVAIGLPGLEKLGEIDFRTLTPTDITSTGTTTVDGVNFRVDGLAASSTIKIDANGLYISGGTGVVNARIDLDDFVSGTFDGTTYKLVGFTMEVQEPSNSLDWAVGFTRANSGSWNDAIVAVRFTSENNIQWQRRRAGAITFDGDTVNRSANWAIGMMCNAGSFGRHEAGTWTQAPDPSLLTGVGTGGGGDQQGWTVFDGTDYMRVWWDKATGRNVRFLRASLWAIRG
jgi:hypothetical protein